MRAAPRASAWLLAALALSACAGGGGSGLAPPAGRAALDCVPFARALSGVQLRGDAADWWSLADGRYQRQAAPAVGSVLVFGRSDRLPRGHVGVVSRVLSARQIALTQANWVHRRITIDQPAIDVSPANDWSLVQVFWPPTGSMGNTVYAAFGFIRPDRPRGTDALLAALPQAAAQAVNP